MEPGTALSGSLDTLPLPELLRLLNITNQSGVLEFRGTAPGVLVLHEGNVVLGLSETGPTLQQVFIGSGLTSADGWWAASERARTTGSLADAVIEAGASPEQVRNVLYEQTVSVIFELLLPSDDKFVFTPDATHPVGTRFSFDPADLLEDASSRVEAWKQIAHAVPSTSVVMRLVRSAPSDTVTISAQEWAVLSLLDGHRTVADLVHELGMSAFTVCFVLHALHTAGLVEPNS
ncbi:MAG: DUF4388 domain-containing protein [Acidimicrobiales bacterium]|nr:DUF4388 domain-containing protein [Acidimicrobiales bacterium]